MADLDLVYEVLDLQLLDVDGRRCGRVDDVELAGGAGEPLRVVALLSGVGAFPERLPGAWLRRLARRWIGPAVLGANVIRIPWADVDEIGAVVRLRRPADELGLARSEREIGAIIARLPGASE